MIARFLFPVAFVGYLALLVPLVQSLGDPTYGRGGESITETYKNVDEYGFRVFSGQRSRQKRKQNEQFFDAVSSGRTQMEDETITRLDAVSSLREMLE